ncbi:MAG: hypothetical protein COB69_04325 [Phycisphaera sp.]|nr:MAG: hypothetical protein COB69_04325 [Phycisphaera sp.]
MKHTTFESEFWERFEQSCRPRIESACQNHLHRMRNTCVDLDDMVSWANCRVWKMIEERPNELLGDDLTPEECADRISNASQMLARWAYLALVRKSTRLAERERPCDMERILSLASTKSSTPRIEKSESTKAAIETLRSRLNADLRGKLAASWKDPAERERVANALGANRVEDEELRNSVASGELQVNTVEKMRSRSLHRSRDIMKALRKNLAVLLLGLSLSVVSASTAFASNGGDDDGGEQTGGRCVVVE